MVIGLKENKMKNKYELYTNDLYEVEVVGKKIVGNLIDYRYDKETNKKIYILEELEKKD